MRPIFDDYDEFEFNDDPSVARLMREQRRDEVRHAGKKSRGPKDHRDFDDYDDFDDYNDFEDDDSYPDYDEEEFDLYAGIGLEH